MPEDPDPIQTGERGTVTHVTSAQVWVKWDSGRRLCLIPGLDVWRVV